MEITYYALDIYATFDWGRLDGIGDIGKWLTTQPPATFLYMQPTRQFHYRSSPGNPFPRVSTNDGVETGEHQTAQGHKFIRVFCSDEHSCYSELDKAV